MATYTRKKCPYCGKTYETYSTYTKQYQNHSGIPFVTCNHCGGHFIDQDIKEPALKPESANEITVVNCIFAMFMPWGLMGILLTIGLMDYDSPPVVLCIIAAVLDIIYVSSVIYFLIKRKILNEEAEREYAESYKRLQNPEYARALKEAGFDVPSWFLKD